jgi:hypothetical protein
MGSSELLASHFATLVFLEIMTDSRLGYFKVFYHRIKSFHIIAFTIPSNTVEIILTGQFPI